MDTDRHRPLDWLIEQADKAYELERDSTSRLRDRAGFVIGLLITPVAGILVSMLATYKGSLFNLPDFVFFTLPMILAFCFMSFSVYKIISFLGRTHEYKIPLPPKDLIDYYKNGNEQDQSLYDTKIIFLRSLSEAFESCLINNKSRLDSLISCQKFAIYSIPLILVCGFKFFHAYHSEGPQIIQVRILNNLEKLKGEASVQSIRIIRCEAHSDSTAGKEPSSRTNPPSTSDTLGSRSCRAR